MAAKSGGDKDAIIYIMPQRIPKKMLQDIKSAVLRTNIPVSEKFDESVSHIVTKYTEYDQVVRQLQRDGTLDIGDSIELSSQVVSLPWLSACLTEGSIVPVEQSHKIQNKDRQSCLKEATQTTKNQEKAIILGWACQRVTPLKHLNEKFTNALETLEEHAEFRDGENDYSRALAFRRASCALKSLPFQVERISQVEGLKDFGSHVLRVMENIIEDGYSEEVKRVSDDWFSLMKLFTSVYGVGPATAKKWLSKGWKSIDDVCQHNTDIKDERILWGLAYHEDLTDSVRRVEAGVFVQLVQQEAEAILPGVIVQLTGGFRRGKLMGHDVDILLTHNEEGREQGLLTSLLQALDRRQRVLTGQWLKSTFTSDDFHRDSKSTLRAQLDQFEKWLGICKFEKAWSAGNSGHACTSVGSEGPRSEDPDDGTAGNGDQLPDDATNTPSACKRQKTDASRALALPASCRSRVPALPLDVSSDRTWKARRVDLIVAPYSQYFYALVGWTGNKHFNRDLRLYAQREMNMKLSSHGLWDSSKNISLHAASEEEVFKNLNLEYREPWERNC